ncbi:MAG: MarR family winged helix-turn-helix transcriptional regulator [Erythrobacter sp.]|nr:MarR family winged helix-turn-helix transcriptional regulator [Erythrobacter sp.]
MGDIERNDDFRSGDKGTLVSTSFFHPLADELMAIASRLRDAATLPSPEDTVPASLAAKPERVARNHVTLARKAYSLRRQRAAIFGNPDLFGEPAWDILLDLYIANAEGKTVSVSSACIGSAAPATTGLRWLGVLTDEGLLVRENDSEDHRRVMVRLTSKGLKAMEQFFDAVEAGD